MTDVLLEKAIREITGQEREILDQFAKAFIAAKSIQTETDVAWLVTHLQLNKQYTNENGLGGWRYWFSFHGDDYDTVDIQNAPVGSILVSCKKCGEPIFFTKSMQLIDKNS